MKTDPIIEIHQVREKFAKECGDDTRRMIERLRSDQAASGRKVVSLHRGKTRRGKVSAA